MTAVYAIFLQEPKSNKILHFQLRFCDTGWLATIDTCFYTIRAHNYKYQILNIYTVHYCGNIFTKYDRKVVYLYYDQVSATKTVRHWRYLTVCLKTQFHGKAVSSCKIAHQKVMIIALNHRFLINVLYNCFNKFYNMQIE